MEEAFSLAKEAGEVTNLMRAYNNLASTRAASQGPMPTAEVLREGLELALRSGTIASAGWIAGSLGDMEQLLGEMSDAEEHEQLAVSLARRVGDWPLIGQRLLSLATVVVMRGRIDDAVALRDEAAPILEANPEPQAFHFIPQFDGYLALGRHDRAAAAEHFAEAAGHTREFSIESFPEIFPDCARAFLLLGERDKAGGYRDLEASTDSVQSAVFAANITGLLEPDPVRSVDLLTDAVAELERLGMRLYAARAMVDLGRAKVRARQDPREVLERARDILNECDARLFLFEVDEVLAL